MEAVLVAAGNWLKAQAISWLKANWPKLVGAFALMMTAVFIMAGGIASNVSAQEENNNASNVCRAIGFSVDSSLYVPPALGQAPQIPTDGDVEGFGPNDGEKIANARAIIAAGKAAGVPTRGLIVAIATALQESQLNNLDHGDRDSQGLFQQRPSQGWGTVEQVTTPDFAARAFFGGPNSPHFNPATGKASPRGLLEIAGWEQMPITVAAQKVQVSGFPDAYAKHEARATTIVNALEGTTAPGPTTPTLPGTGTNPGTGTEGETVFTADQYRAAGVDIDSFCNANYQLASTGGTAPTEPGVTIPAGEWTAPLKSRINSEFGMRFHPVYSAWRLHEGTDFRAATGTPVVAASNGIVKKVSWMGGGGLVVILTHADGIETWYLHLSQALVKPGDTIEGGQRIALSGATGVGTAAHFHFETRVNGKPVNPVPFMAERGVDLRAWS
ncbi:M23 family metallopeptidase [Oerskovia sp. Sa1BUA8]|uniref:M23 family metallopeptidase n=1 Tax=Oerskovia douganii TaxID=2762210 RepID=A0A9D5UDT8_9CELL|nr:M23 family metallopeptidase [Oerskovia douganii]MBE7702166.1 M23 family metallopeptidase [Oerskovia douganii]